MAVKPSVSRTSHYSNWAHFVAGGTGGAVGAIVTCPLEVIKTRLQALTKTTELTGMIGTRTYKAFLEIWKHEGIRGLWKGIGPNLIGVGPSRAIHFSTYSGTKHFLTNTLDFKESSGIHLTSAIVAGVTVHTVTAPIWLVKTRMQLQVEGKTVMPYRNSLDCVRRVWTEEGIRGFYKGLVASYVGISESAVQFVLYEKFKNVLQVHKFQNASLSGSNPYEDVKQVSLTTSEYLTVASTAKLIAAVVSYPHEVVRTRLREQRAEDPKHPHKYKGFVQSLKLIAIEEGIKGLYGGLGAHLLRVVPNAAIMFVTYESIVKLLS